MAGGVAGSGDNEESGRELLRVEAFGLHFHGVTARLQLREIETAGFVRGDAALGSRRLIRNRDRRAGSGGVSRVRHLAYDRAGGFTLGK